MSDDRPAAGTGDAWASPAGEAVPDEVRAAALRAFTRRDRDAELLDIVGDSVLDHPQDATPREVAFSSPARPLVVRVVVGAVTAEQRLTLDVTTDVDGVEVTDVDCAAGTAGVERTGTRSWRVGPVASGLVSLVLDENGHRLRTSWLHV